MDCGEVIMRGLEVQVVTHPALPCLVLQTEGEELMVEREGREGRRVVNWFKPYFTVGTVLTPTFVLVLIRIQITYTKLGFSRKSGFKKIVLTPKLGLLVLNWDSRK